MFTFTLWVETAVDTLLDVALVDPEVVEQPAAVLPLEAQPCELAAARALVAKRHTERKTILM